MEQQSEVIQQPSRTASSDADSGCALDEYTWVPQGLTAQQVAEYMHALPVHCIPYAGGSVGDRWRANQLLRQLPPQDTEVRYCHGLSDEEKRELRLFSAQRRHDSLGRATVLSTTVSSKCHQCDGTIHASELAVYASRAKPGTVWHPACFICCICTELLVDLVYFLGKDGRLYCGRHHAETLKPRCSACDEIIFSDECTEAEGHSWHTKHFVCCDCDVALGGQRYVMTDGRPLCCVCYERLYAATCVTCRQTIHVTDGHMVHGSRRWHAADSCFCCDSCACSLLGCPFVAVPGKDAIFCADCGIIHKATTSLSYMDMSNGVMGGNSYSPSSPMMKVQELTSKAVGSKFEDVDGEKYVEQTWLEDSNVKEAAKCVSPCKSPAVAEMQTHSACTSSALCCDDHRLSAEFEVCTSSQDHLNTGVIALQPLYHNVKPSLPVSYTKHSADDIRSTAQTTECNDVIDATVCVSSPRPPVLVAPGADCLDNIDVDEGLEELIVEPLWSRSEPNGLLAAGGTEVTGESDEVRQRSRKSKNLNVRFDPSTKDTRSPVAHSVYCEHRRPASRRFLDDSDVSYMSRAGGHCHSAGLDGSASVRIRRRKFGHGRHRGQSYIWSDVDMKGSRSQTGSMNQGSGWWTDRGDDYEHCSTCSSSSSDSDFDYSSAAFSSGAAPVQSQTLPQRRYNAASVGTVQQVQRSRKHKKKQCVVS